MKIDRSHHVDRGCHHVTIALSVKHLLDWVTRRFVLQSLKESLGNGRLSPQCRSILETRAAVLQADPSIATQTYGDWCEDLAQHLNETTSDRATWVRYFQRKNGTHVCQVLDANPPWQASHLYQVPAASSNGSIART